MNNTYDIDKMKLDDPKIMKYLDKKYPDKNYPDWVNDIFFSGRFNNFGEVKEYRINIEKYVEQEADKAIIELKKNIKEIEWIQKL
jgi:hypothetical protein